MKKFVISALYHFTHFENPSALRSILKDACSTHRIKGSLLLAHEGINGTIAGTRSGIEAILKTIASLPGCASFEHKESYADEMPFLRMKVKLKKEIVTMGKPDVDPLASVGTYIAPKDWNDLITSDDVVVIDTRNDYEVGIGTFKDAIDPDTKSFREFPNWWHENKDRFHNKRIAMFCTGGIRCEKASNYLLGEGVPEVFHLKGGVLKYLEDIKESDTTWEGECFVFDQRVSVAHGLKVGKYDLCYACRRPISETDKQNTEYQKGISCPHCIDETSSTQKQRFIERQHQVELAKKRGKKHIGSY